MKKTKNYHKKFPFPRVSWSKANICLLFNDGNTTSIGGFMGRIIFGAEWCVIFGKILKLWLSLFEPH